MATEKTEKNRYADAVYRVCFAAVVVLLVAAYIAYKFIWPGETWIVDVIGLIGGFASLTGVFLALVQIRQTNEQVRDVSTIAAATQKAVLENRDDIRRFLSFSDMAHLIEQTKNTQNYIRTKDYRSAVILMQGIKDDLLRSASEFKDILEKLDMDLTEQIKNMNLDIASLVNNIMQTQGKTNRQSTIKPDVIHGNLEKAREVFIKIETHLKKEKL